MDKLTPLLNEVNRLTLEIEENYPEIYEHLNENPLTISSPNKEEEIDKKVLLDYLESLREILKRHVESHTKVLT